MKKYFNKKIFTAILLCFLLLTTSSVFSLFYFSLNTSATIGGEENLLVDDIAENYNMDPSDRLASDYYEVSFFPNPRAATASDANGIHNYYLKYTDIPTGTSQEDLVVQEELAGWEQVFYSSNDQATYGKDIHNESSGREYIQEQMRIIGFPVNHEYYFGNYVYGKGTLFDGYWGNYVEKTDTGSEPPVSSYAVTDTENFAKPIDRTVYQAVTPSLLYEIENTYQPATATRDTGEWPMTFNGWSYSQDVAANHGYGWQGDFKLYDFGMDLEAYDMMKPDGTIATEAERGQPAIDGTLIGDHKVYLYAVYTSGKDYAQNIAETSGTPPVDSYAPDHDYGSRFDSLRITKGGGKEVTSKYMAFKPTQDGYKPDKGNIRTDYGYYYYNGLTIMPDESNTYFDLAFGLANSKGWDGTWGKDHGTSQSQLIDLQGNYNVYVYLMKNNFNVDVGTALEQHTYYYQFADAQNTEAYDRASGVETTIDEEWLDVFVSEENGNNPILPEDLRSKITNNQIRKIIDTGSQNYYATQEKNWTARIANFRAIILVERNYEFRLTGNLMHSFNYDDSEHVMYGSSSNGIVDTSTYYLERVYLSNNSDQLFNYHYNYEGESFNSLFKENVFTFHADRGRLNYKVSINDSDEAYQDTADYIQPASGTNDEAAFNNGNGEYDYYLPNNPNNIIESVDDKIGYNDKLLKFVGNTGYYDLKVKVEYSATNGQNAEISNVIVSVKPSHLKAFIKIYDDDLIERYESGFINHSATPTYLVSSDTNHEFSTNITVNYDDKLFNNGTYSFKDIIDNLPEGKALINHVTQKPITENDFPMNIDKSYIFYIGTVE